MRNNKVFNLLLMVLLVVVFLFIMFKFTKGKSPKVVSQNQVSFKTMAEINPLTENFLEDLKTEPVKSKEEISEANITENSINISLAVSSKHLKDFSGNADVKEQKISLDNFKEIKRDPFLPHVTKKSSEAKVVEDNEEMQEFSLKLEGIWGEPERRYAIINDEILKVGDKIYNYVIKSIEKDSVTLLKEDGESLVINIEEEPVLEKLEIQEEKKQLPDVKKEDEVKKKSAPKKFKKQAVEVK